jgi:hypothetical protein
MYQDEQNSIVAVRYQCNMTTGEYFTNTGGFLTDPLASNGDQQLQPPQPHPNTSFAGVILSSNDGERWLYHDSTRRLQSIRFKNFGAQGQWTYEGPVSPDNLPGMGIGFAMTPTQENTTAVFPKDDSNIEVSTYNTDTTWHICE